MTPSFDQLLKQLKKLPGLGYRSAERIALHLLVEKTGKLARVTKFAGPGGRSCQTVPPMWKSGGREIVRNLPARPSG